MMISHEKLSFGYFTVTLDKNHLNLTKKLPSTEYLKAKSQITFNLVFKQKITNCNYDIYPSQTKNMKELKTTLDIFARFAKPTFCDDFRGNGS